MIFEGMKNSGKHAFAHSFCRVSLHFNMNSSSLHHINITVESELVVASHWNFHIAFFHVLIRRIFSFFYSLSLVVEVSCTSGRDLHSNGERAPIDLVSCATFSSYSSSLELNPELYFSPCWFSFFAFFARHHFSFDFY